ncbi:1-aminocyclopropane-1-carboxylate synthase [Quillaja saponaria]|uniref:1-aminocyclopropane-1-carboxylate synthase n=1 Tax=Quillaja saponaria TaxID=32244 RepID=A0AAD7M3X5_QUISA|nr:1-aminocyclopropane-1-carboxylate synthase [Quillaja saponaria]
MAIEIEIEQPSVGLSKISVSDTHGEDSPYFAGWKAYDEDPYDESTNPSGVIQMGLAENQVSFDLLEEYLEQNSEASSRDRVVLTAGATAANELLTFILADPGDAMLVPTPYYPGFDRDLRWRTGVKIVPIQCDSSNNFQITPQALESAYKEPDDMNIKVGGVLITNPSNPLGATIQRLVLEVIFGFVTRKNIHLVSDKIYSARRMSSFTLISSQTQHLLASMLSDKKFTENYIKTNRERLSRRYEMIIEGLRNAGIECLKGNAGLFCWMNLSSLLEKATREGELAIWDSMLHEVKLNISPGSSCHCCQPGWFRVCFANMSEKTQEVALARIHKFMEQKRPK